ncbi:monofunctional biosynthetic peptidoglycan transglycosylase [Virgibacillus profundi]|uniref:Monofunctional biosynthetic peptidoglycan transglycosylase n=1 Tax=Virgibacillus profundi TaxID=2024555 RepID=A0A2A2IJW2_9BACI|nr:PBP1A family penicillin-binding protein [Virgibacillus profundi]PAV31395.1 monofunctional biosynthetic peptidoglycan transglycosylase [Virgibacillus profundi]PXY55581.1 monofunctional biosynthetic peptidoglycan transglycosylase [Virgibacillus profundi]
MGKKFNKNRFIIKILLGAFLLFLSVILGVYLVSFILGPPTLTNQQNTIYYSNSDEIIGEESGSENRYWVELDEMSPAVIDATLMIEDKHFYDHHGFDFRRIAGAIWKDIQSFSLKEGASTLTQQYARNLFLTHEKTWERKLKEAFYTIRLEMYYSKDEILEGYLNTIYYGHGAYGIEAASNHFFNKSAKKLTLAEASMLAGIPKGPTYYSPLNDEERAKNRQLQILKSMLNEKKITEQEYDLATGKKLTYADQTDRNKVEIGSYFQDVVLQEASKILELDSESIRSGGFQIYTTLNIDYQKQLESKINTTVNHASEIQAGAIAMEPKTGGIRAMVGGRNYEESPFNRATMAKRMPGSAFKPFLYYTALENGYTPSTMLMSKPTTFELENAAVYSPSNFNGYYANQPITLARALALSDNVYAVKTNMFLGADKLVETAKNFGITSELPAVPSLALGTAAVTVEEMVTGYGLPANGGKKIDGYTIEKIIDRDGKTVFERDNDSSELVLDPQKAFILTQLMTGMFDRELDGYMAVTGSSIANDLTHLYAGKSGTTDSDSWMIGFSPSLVAGVWIGYDDNRSMEIVAESTYAKNIWAGFMESAHEGLPQEKFPSPAGVVGIPIDPATGERATPYCDASRVMYYEKGTEPESHCTEHFHIEGNEKEDNKGILEKLFEMFN